ncbi:hypothetical protein BDZ97DRAFT_1809470 [Flammula alnicola]|nr:hypothetical protein BDZ97DRAFT_1809470 [Flammula alnicola]
MGKNSEFPWDLLKAECLRLVCSQLVQASSEGASYTGAGRKEDMIDFLRDVDERGLDPAVKTLERRGRTPRKSVGTAQPPSPSKRKSSRLEEDAADQDEDEGYNTRYKGVKRVKVRQETPEKQTRTPRKVGRPRKDTGDDAEYQAKPTSSPRKSVGTASAGPAKRGRGRPRKSAPEVQSSDAEGGGSGQTQKSVPQAGEAGSKPQADAQADAGTKPKRGRGRPRKSTNADSAPASKGKQVFDGVLLKKRKAGAKNQAANGDVGAEDDADGEGDEEDAVLTAVNGNDAQADGSSSLGGSNKENDPNEAFRYTTGGGDNDADMDADGDPDADTEVPAVAA